MPYSNPGIPRFYVNVLEWLHSVNYLWYWVNNQGIYTGGGTNHYRTLPIEPNLPNYQSNFQVNIKHELPQRGGVSFGSFNQYSFCAVLGHGDLDNSKIYINDTGTTETNIVNWATNNIPLQGFHMMSFDASDAITIRVNITPNYSNVGSVVLGTYYDMPHSPGLNLTMEREMNIKRVRTKGGNDLIDYKYNKPTMWGNAAAWELHDGSTGIHKLSRGGRRIWDLSFTLSESDLFPDSSNVAWEGSYANYTASMGKTLLEDNTFYSQVIHRTHGLPFIFQPDNKYPDFAICKFNQSSFKFSQVANGLYNVKLKIREVW